MKNGAQPEGKKGVGGREQAAPLIMAASLDTENNRLLEIENLSKRFGDSTVLTNIAFSVRAKEIVVVGPAVFPTLGSANPSLRALSLPSEAIPSGKRTSSAAPVSRQTSSGQISLDEANPEQSTVEVTIKTTSVNTSNDTRDQDLKSPNFFDAEKFPEIAFKSKSLKRTGQNTADVTGDLTLHGVTKEVVLKVELLGKGTGPQGTTVSGWDAMTTLKRSDFCLTWNKMIEGTHVVGGDVQVELHVEADKQ